MGFTNGLPELGIHDKLFPDEIARKSWGFIRAMIESMIYAKAECVIEGEALLPELIVQLRDKYSDELKICFVGYTEISADEKVKFIKNNSEGKGDWLTENSDSYIIEHVYNMIEHSKLIKISCKETDIKYIDTSAEFESAIEKTIRYLMS